MSIQKFTHAQLDDLPLTVQASDPNGSSCVKRSHALAMPGREQARFGVWDASVGSFQREVAAGEIMHILAGRATFTEDGGNSVDMRPGDVFVFGPDTRGTWVIEEPLRKFYVLV